MASRQTDRLIEARHAGRSGRAAELRKAANLSQEEVAAEVGVTREAVAHWEAGRRRPGGAPALRWATLLARLEKLVGEEVAPTTQQGADALRAGR